ncbi:hypothetical protein K438DRAFT_1824692 [Mycena galopus ATCC 62051]|nr:hypothetical protein K438DRAFT_1824692 [Mycena galopus ATCC 62051]
MAMNLYVGLNLSENASLLGNFLESYLGGTYGDRIRWSLHARCLRTLWEGRGDNRDFGDILLLERIVEHRAQHIRRERLQARKKKNIAFQNRLGRQTWRMRYPRSESRCLGLWLGALTASLDHIGRRREKQTGNQRPNPNIRLRTQRNSKIPGTAAKSRNEDVLSQKTILVTLCVLTAGVFVDQLTVLTVAVTLRWPLRQHR